MAFMRNDVNIMLLLLIVVSVILFTGFSVYYQTSFKKVSEEYQDKLNQLQSVTQELQTQREELNETYSLRLKAETDKNALDEKFQDAAGENDQLKNQNSNLQSDLSSTKANLVEKSAELDATKSLLEQTQIDLVRMTQSRDGYKADLQDVCGDYEAETGNEHRDC